MSALTGEHFWAGERHPGSGQPFAAVEAATGEEQQPIFHDATAEEVDAAVQAAARAAAPFAAMAPAARAAFLRRIADEMLELGDALLACAQSETALPEPRLQMERGRTMNQLRLFADLVEEGSWVDARIDHAEPDRQPMPKPDLRAMLVPLGPVAVFGASNFPLAYSVAGGDTASALAAGCPVVVKGHPAHPGTSELVAGAVVRAAAATGVPAGVFGMVHGRGHEPGGCLVEHPAITAVGFTGSAVGGQALVRLAAARPQPIPVFAEMGSVNPVFVLPGAMAERSAAIAEALAASVTLGTGQFCTCPGMVMHDASAAGERFVAELGERLGATAAGVMVHPQLVTNYRGGVAQVEGLSDVTMRATGSGYDEQSATTAEARLFTADVATVLAQDRLREEVFGPAVVAVRYGSSSELLEVARGLDGHLTATIHGTEADLQEHAELVALLQAKVGRLLFGGVPTGVEVCASMQHGGPWPASSDSRFTAVGPRAILRWARPVCLQNAPAGQLPAALRDDNPMGLWRTVDGVHDRH
ncbi:MAG: aldehyde dehydrogenase (NADP(+)) [Planctomycetota bacterium]|nr:aldehyde dehydrogenase (NADP(+)) [Planctomycetota bacterium]